MIRTILHYNIMKRIVVRIDDLCPTMDYAQFRVAVEQMDRYDIKPLLGVIPDCQDPDLRISSGRSDFWEFVRELQNRGYTIAMHGYRHLFDSHVRGMAVQRCDSEFAGRTYDEQLEMIRRGREILESHGYIPIYSLLRDTPTTKIR